MEQKNRKYPEGIQILTCDAKKCRFEQEILQMFDQKMCLKVLAVAVIIVKGISVIKDFCVVNTQ